MPRSGSTPIYYLLEAQLQSLKDSKGLGEIFNPIATEVINSPERNEIKLNKLPRKIQILDQSERKNRHNQFLKESSDRFAILKEQKNCIFKVIPSHIPDLYDNWLATNADWLILIRRRVWPHLLSYCISDATDIWYGNSFENLRIEVLHQNILQYEREFFRFLNFTTKLENHRTVFYEDFLNLGAQYLFKAAGICPASVVNHDTTPRRTVENKHIITNLIQVEQWFKSSAIYSFLNDNLNTKHFKYDLSTS